MYEGMIELKKQMLKFTASIICLIIAFCGCNKEGNKKAATPIVDESAVISLQMRQSTSFNPLSQTHHSVRDVFFLCYEPLFTFDANLMAEGVLAENIALSDDCLSAVITLKDSITWHDGVKFTSADVVHTVNLIKENPQWEYYYECVKYISTVTAIDATSVKITLSRPYAQLAHSLYFPIVASHNDSIEENMIGTGPYQFEKYTPAASMEFKSFSKWHGGQAICGKVNVSIIRENEIATTAFNTNLLHAVTSDSFDLENTVPKSHSKTTPYPSNEYEFIAFNHNNEALASQALRNAISSAIDRDALTTECYAANAQPANTPVHPSAKNYSNGAGMSEYSLVNAQELLFLEGYTKDEKSGILTNSEGEKLSFSMLVNKENQTRVRCAQKLCQQLFSAGIEINVLQTDFEDYLSKIENGEYDMYIGGIKLANIYDYEALLSTWGELNTYGYSGEDMENALAALSSSPTKDSFSDAIFNFEEVFLREQPVCGLVFYKDVLITNHSIEGERDPRINYPYKNLSGWSIKK